MLSEIYIENFAIIDKLHIQFSGGLNIITGETGAGKSIMVDALMIALGGRASAEFIRTGAERAVIEAIFTIAALNDAQAKASEYGFFDAESGDTDVLIRREISRNGRNRLLVNGHPATSVMVAELGDLLLDIHGQHEHQSVMNPDYHVELLDLYGKLLPPREEVAAAYRRFKKVERELKDLRDHSRERMQHLDLMRFQHEEIQKADLRPGEDDELLHERKILAGAEQLASGANMIQDMLDGDHGAALDILRKIVSRLEDLAGIDESLDAHLKTCESAQYQLEDVAAAMRNYAQSVEFDEARLNDVEKRIDELNTLKRKYGNTIEDILKLHEEIAQELTTFDQRETREKELDAEYHSLRNIAQQRSQQLSDDRKRAAARFEQEIMRELALLSMEKTRFSVEFKIEFLIAPNPGEPLKPLSKIASGGEISRIMLAMKTLLGEADRVPVMVFDEIDTGIGGKVAEIVGKKLRQVSASHQVICITHLPQIASKGDTHFHVEKRAEDDRTTTFIRELSGQTRIEEIARMLGGETLTKTTLDHAREMLGAAAEK